MGRIEALTAYQMAKRISERKENIYDIGTIKNILDAYMDECYKALLDGERVQISKVGTIIPEVKTHEHFNLPICNKEGGNPPYTRFRISRNKTMQKHVCYYNIVGKMKKEISLPKESALHTNDMTKKSKNGKIITA